MEFENEMSLKFSSNSNNESFARVCIASFVSYLDPTLSELNDIKTAVSEAVTNSIIHGYEDTEGDVWIKCGIAGNKVYIEVRDSGKGIKNLEQAMEPLYTSKPEMERSGMGFTVMETFMDEFSVHSRDGVGTSIHMSKKIMKERWGSSVWIQLS